MPETATADRELLSEGHSVPHSIVPSDPVAARAFLQARVELYLLIALIIWGISIISDRVIAATTASSVYPTPAGDLYWNAVALAVLSVGYALVKWRRLSELTLRAVEIFTSVVQGALAASLVGKLALAVRPDLMSVFAATLILMLRTGLIPGSARVALVVGALTMVPTLVLTYHLYSTRPLVPEGLDRATALAYITQWSVISLFATTTIQSVIYGLRVRVLELGQYTLQYKIGEGGMGVVYRARHALLRRPTAIKILPVARMNPTGIARFEREVQLTAELAHPNIISVYDFGRAADGSFYYAMEFLDGIDLQRLVEDTGPVSEARAVHILQQVADALAEAHAVDLIHRDVKPANLLLSNPERRPDHLTVLDFGLARNFSDADPGLSDVRTITGSPLYMSPESIKDPGSIDARSDLYALGAVAYWLLTGTPPFQGKTVVEVCASHLHMPLELPSARTGQPMTPALEQLIADCLAKDRAARPPNAQAVLERLRALAIPAWRREQARAWWSAHPLDHAELGSQLALTRTLAIAPRERD